MAGWNLKAGAITEYVVSEDRIWSLFNFVFSDACKKRNTYKFGLIRRKRRCKCANVEDEYIHVDCPCCKNKRLFDLLRGSKGIVSMKCSICKVVVAVSLHDGRASSNKKL